MYLIWSYLYGNLKIHPFSFILSMYSHMIPRNPTTFFSPQGISSVQTGVSQSIFFFSAVKVFLDGRFILEWSSPLSSCQLISGNFWHLCPSSVKWRAAGSCVLHHTALNTLSTSCCATHHHMFTKTRDLRLFISLCLFHLWTQYDKSCSKYYIY